MKWMCIILSAMIVACAQQPKKVHHHHAAKHGRVVERSSPAPTPSTVDADWVAHYQALEKEFHYTVPDDNKIKSVGNGFDVPKSVRTHYEDMLRAKGEQDANR